jgi:hypothetical protein
VGDKHPASRRDLLLRQVRDALILLASAQYAPFRRLFQLGLEEASKVQFTLSNRPVLALDPIGRH